MRKSAWRYLLTGSETNYLSDAEGQLSIMVMLHNGTCKFYLVIVNNISNIVLLLFS